MSTTQPTADWEKVGDRYYRKIELYASIFDPDLELENYHVCGAPCGGAIALYRKEGVLHSYRGPDSSAQRIDLYSCSGKHITSINWTHPPIVGLGWSIDETLIVVSRDGTVRSYAELSDKFSVFNLGNGAEDHEVVGCKFWSSGFVALLGNNQVIAVSKYDEPRPKLLATPPSDPVVSWTVIPPAYTLSRSVEVLLAINQTINVVDSTDSKDMLLQNGPFSHISVSPDGRFTALYTDDGKIWVISSDFQEKHSEYDSRSKVKPRDMQWCGDDAVVVTWDDEVLLVGPNGVAVEFSYDGAWVQVVPDVDGVRLLTTNVCEFLQSVPDASEEIFKLGSTSAASILLDCVEQLEKQSPKADDNLQMIQPRLIDAVNTCIEAAGHEFNVHWQKQLMKAASFGKTVLDLFDSDEFVRMTEELRVLNAVRFHEVGMPLSYRQLDWLGPEKLITRLLNRRDYPLALRLSEFLHLPTEQVYLHWAIQKVRVSSEDSESTAQSIVAKLKNRRGISFEEIARAAHEDGRHPLATELLNHEPRAGKQVPLLLDMEEDTIALDKAIDSGDTDLILAVLVNLKDKVPRATFFRTINTRPVATALVESTAMSKDTDLLKALYYQDDRRLDGSNLLLRDALAQHDTEATLSKLRAAALAVKDSKEDAAHARALDEYQRLIRLQATLDADSTISPSAAAATTTTSTTDGAPPPPPQKRFAGLSLNQTLSQLIQLGAAKRAAKVAADFGVPEKTQWYVRLRAHVAARAFRELEEVAATHRKSPIGWGPFFAEALAAGAPRTAAAFVPKFADRDKSARDKSDMYELCGMLGKAAEEAHRGKDKARLEQLRARATGADLVEVERLLALLAKGR